MCIWGILSPLVLWCMNNTDSEVLYSIGPTESRKREKSKGMSFFSEGSEPLLQHVTRDCLMNQGGRKKNTSYGNLNAVLAFWVYKELCQDAQIPYMWEPISEAELLVKHCCNLMCNMNPFWDQTIGSCNKPVISIFVSRQLIPLGEWKIALLHI